MKEGLKKRSRNLGNLRSRMENAEFLFVFLALAFSFFVLYHLTFLNLISYMIKPVVKIISGQYN